MVALAVRVPIVATMGGTASVQALTVAVRGIAMKELTVSNALRAVCKEIIVGMLNGLLFALLIELSLGLVCSSALGGLLNGYCDQFDSGVPLEASCLFCCNVWGSIPPSLPVPFLPLLRMLSIYCFGTCCLFAALNSYCQNLNSVIFALVFRLQTLERNLLVISQHDRMVKVENKDAEHFLALLEQRVAECRKSRITPKIILTR